MPQSTRFPYVVIYRPDEYQVGKYEELFKKYIKNNAANSQKWCIISRHKTLTNANIALDKHIVFLNRLKDI